MREVPSKAEELIFVDRADNAGEAVQYADRRQACRIVALSSSAMWALEKQSCAYATPYDYSDLAALHALNEDLYYRTQRICDRIQEKVFVQISCRSPHELRVGEAFFHPIKCALNTVCHRVLTLQAVMRRERPSTAVVFERLDKRSVAGTYLDPGEVPILDELTKLVLGSNSVAVRVIHERRRSRLATVRIHSVRVLSRAVYRLLRNLKLRAKACRKHRQDRAAPVLGDPARRLDILAFRAHYSAGVLCDHIRRQGLGTVIEFEHWQDRSDVDVEKYRTEIVADFDELWARLAEDRQFNTDLSVEGINLLPVLNTYLRHLLVEGAVRVLSVVAKTRAILDRGHVKALLLPTVTFMEEWACATACRQRGIPVITWQHGSCAMFTPHTQPLYYDIRNADCSFVFGEGVRESFAGAAEKYGTQVIAVGSCQLDRIRSLRDRPLRRTSPHVKTVLVPLRGLNVGVLGDSYQTYPPNVYWQELKEMLVVFASLPQLHFVLKLYPSDGLKDTPVTDFLKTRKIKNATVRNKPGFSKLLPIADLVIIDWPYTTLLEAAKADLPIVCYSRFWKLSESVRPLMDARCLTASTTLELKALLDDFTQNRLAPRHDSRLLERYGTHINDGRSLYRALAHLSRIVSAQAPPIPRAAC